MVLAFFTMYEYRLAWPKLGYKGVHKGEGGLCLILKRIINNIK